MRALVLVLAGLLCALAPAQARQATLGLVDGTEVTGWFVDVNEERIVLKVGGRDLAFTRAQVRTCVFRDANGQEPAAGNPPANPPATGPATTPAAPGGAAAAAPSGAPSGGTAPPPGAQDPAPAAQPPVQDPGAPTPRAGQPGGQPAGQAPAAGEPTQDDGGAAPGPRSTPRSRQLWERRMEALDMRFPWLFPAEPLQWISLGITLFALLSLGVHFAARVAATEEMGFGRAAAMGFWMLVAGIAQTAVVPGSREALGLAGALNAAVAIVLFRVVYGLSLAASLLALCMFSVQGGLLYGLLMLIDATLRSIGNTTF